MSVKTNKLIAAAALALGVTVTASAVPVCEQLLNDKSVIKLQAAQVDATGRTIVFVTLQDGQSTVVRPVCDNKGDVRLFTDLAAVAALVKRAKINAGSKVEYVRLESITSIGDPVAKLKSLYLAMKSERVTSGEKKTAMQAKKLAAEQLGWNDQSNTPEAAEYADYVVRIASITEWDDFVGVEVTRLAAALTAAGVSPLPT